MNLNLRYYSGVARRYLIIFPLFLTVLLLWSYRTPNIKHTPIFSRHDDHEGIYVSVVFATRNDNYGGGYFIRLQNCLTSLMDGLTKYNINAEIIAVEWNTDPKSPPLRETIKDMDLPFEKVPVTVISVPNSFHETFPTSKTFMVLEHHAKNIAARKSKGKWILVVNTDNIFADEIFAAIKTQTLDERSFYRTPRYDGPTMKLETPANIRKQLKDYEHTAATTWYNYDHPIWFPIKRILTFTSVPFPYGKQHCLSGVDYNDQKQIDSLKTDIPYNYASGDFMLISRNAYYDVHGFYQLAVNFHLDAAMIYELMNNGYMQVVLLPPCYIYHQGHGYTSARGVRLPGLEDSKIIEYAKENKLKYIAKHLQKDDALGPNWGHIDQEFESVTIGGPDR